MTFRAFDCGKDEVAKSVAQFCQQLQRMISAAYEAMNRW